MRRFLIALGPSVFGSLVVGIALSEWTAIVHPIRLVAAVLIGLLILTSILLSYGRADRRRPPNEVNILSRDTIVGDVSATIQTNIGGNMQLHDEHAEAGGQSNEARPDQD